jgi:hypothetical protein
VPLTVAVVDVVVVVVVAAAAAAATAVVVFGILYRKITALKKNYFPM